MKVEEKTTESPATVKQTKAEKMKGNTRGVKFSATNQPKNPGRKPSRMTEFIKAFDMESPARAISQEDAMKLMTHILFCNRSQLETMIKNSDLPIFLLCLIKGILSDTTNGRTETVERLFDRLFGRSMQPIELTGAKGRPLIPNTPMSRKAYEAMLEELQTTGTIKKSAIPISNN
jgi:hypothetical protein